MDFASAIKEIRRRNFLSQVDFAKVVDVSFSTINRWETGKTLPNMKTAKKINEYCQQQNIDIRIDQILWEEK